MEIKSYRDLQALPHANDNIKTISNRAVLGYDIYQFSKYTKEKIRYVPMVFDLLLDTALSLCTYLEKSFFPKLKEDYIKNMQHTGDGGFLFFDTPLQALIANTYFYYCLRLFNSGFLFPNVYSFIDAKEYPLTVRSAITYGESVPYTNVKDVALQNFNGFSLTAVVTCNRIINRDKLDRFLMDKNAYTFFVTNFFGLENLPSFDINDITHWLMNNDPNKIESEEKRGAIPIISHLLQPVHSTYTNRNNSFLDCRALKIGKLKNKDDEIDVYNVEVRALLSTAETLNVLHHLHGNKPLIKAGKTYPEYIITTIGNLNTLGLGETQIKIE